MKEDAEAAKQQEIARNEQLKFNSRVSSFTRASKEIQCMFVNLNQMYTIPLTDFSRDEMIKRHSDIPSFASEFQDTCQNQCWIQAILSKNMTFFLLIYVGT